MVTAILAGLAVTVALDVAPAAARRSHPPDLFRELFGPPVRWHGRVHQSKASREKRANEKATSESKAVSAPKPAANPGPAAEPKTAEPKTAEPKTAQPKTAEPKTAEPKAAEPKSESKPSPEAKSAPEAKEPHDLGEAAGKVPLPQPRPAEASRIEPDKPASRAETAAPTPTPRPASTPEGPPPPSACRLALTEGIAIAPSVPDIHGPGECGGEDLVRLEAIVLPDKHRVAMKPAATMRCAMAAAIADWVRGDVEPLAQGMGSELTELENLDAYECRGRNGISGAPLSEHGRANAIDVHAFKLASGRSLGLTDRDVPRETRESVLHSVCTRFTTVLGPGSDGYHEDHIHLDLRERHNNYKICQWNVWDSLPQVAPLMPEVRPGDAPPRRMAGSDDGAKPQDAKSGAKANEKANEKVNDKADDKTSDKSGRDHDGKTTAAPAAPADPDSRADKSNRTEKSRSATSKSKPGKNEKADQSEPDDEPATKKRRQRRRF
jgi:hypothetical protein